MANLANIIAHLRADVERQRHLTRMQQLRNETAAFDMLRVAAVLRGGASLNATKGTMPFALANASRGQGTVAMASPLAGVTIYTPVQPAAPRRRRGRR
jgi:hypothetical protein